MPSKSTKSAPLTNIINRTIVAAQQQERSRRVEAADALQILRLPVLRHGVPDADLPRRRQRHQLRPDEEQVLHAHRQRERPDLRLVPIIADRPQSYLAAVGDGQHLGVIATHWLSTTTTAAYRTWPRPCRHLGIQRHPLDRMFDVRRREHQLAGGMLSINVKFGLTSLFPSIHPSFNSPATLQSP